MRLKYRNGLGCIFAVVLGLLMSTAAHGDNIFVTEMPV
jgi:hypothetical protein